MSDRLQRSELLPDAYKRLLNLNQRVDREAETHGVDPKILELVKIRASQINGCAFCADLHNGRALGLGETQRRILMLPVWQESGLFDEAESAALALAEAITHISSAQDVSDEVYLRAAKQFNDEQVAVIVWATAEIQLFNALNVTSRKPLPED